MQFWTPRIALVAYLLGGWLLPLTHQHHCADLGEHAHCVHSHHPAGTIGCCPDGDCSAAIQHGAIRQSSTTLRAEQWLDNGLPVESPSACGCGCASDSDAVPVDTVPVDTVPSEQAKPARQTVTLALTAHGHTAGDCSGLCALCIAQSMGASLPTVESSLIDALPLAEQNASGGRAWLPCQTTGGLSSRGPPPLS